MFNPVRGGELVYIALFVLVGLGCVESRNADSGGERDSASNEHAHAAGSGDNAGTGAAGACAASDEDVVQARAASEVARGNAEPQNQPKIDDQAYAQVVQQLNRFGLNLGRRYTQENELMQRNSAYSPLSVSLALAMTYAGARARTADAFKSVLSGGIDADVFHAGVNRLSRELASRALREPQDSACNPRKVELNFANSVFVDKVLRVEPDFLDQLSRHYDSGLHLEDFVNDPEQARLHINDWVAGRTHDRIQNLLQPGMVNDLTRIVLVNALYFYGTWRTAFQASATRDAEFHTLANTTVTVPTMHSSSAIRYSKGSDYAAIDLPYIGHHLSMFVVLPDEGKFEDVREVVSEEWLKSALVKATVRTVSLALPKFKTTTPTFYLTESLKEMGLAEAFSGNADFTGIANAPLRIVDVVQKAFVSVDENGAEAAAATAVIAATGSAAPVEIIELSFDRPFLFFVHDDSGAVLFYGQIVDPSASP